jgi:type IV pilus assembly protein PilN
MTIRINLMAADRPTQKTKKVSSSSGGGSPGSFQAYLFLVLFIGGALALCGGAWLWKSNAIKELDTQIEASKKRQLELQAIKAQVDEYEKQKRILDAKLNLILKLQAAQSGPVHMLDEISKALPDYVWLTTLDQNGNNLRFKGQSSGLPSVADFISNLQHQGAPSCAEPAPSDRPADRTVCYFNNVELVSGVDNNNVIDFEVSAAYQNAAARMQEASKQAAAPAAAAPAAPAGAPVKKP